MSDRQHLREEVVGFLNTVARPGCHIDRMDDDANLIDAGVNDSLAVVQIIAYLEQNYDLNSQVIRDRSCRPGGPSMAFWRRSSPDQVNEL